MKGESLLGGKALIGDFERFLGVFDGLLMASLELLVSWKEFLTVFFCQQQPEATGRKNQGFSQQRK